MKAIIRQNGIMMIQFEGNMALDFVEKCKDFTAKTQTNSTDVFYRFTQDSKLDLHNGMTLYFWKDETTISVFLT